MHDLCQSFYVEFVKLMEEVEKKMDLEACDCYFLFFHKVAALQKP